MLHVWIKNSHRLPNVTHRILCNKRRILRSLMPNEHPVSNFWKIIGNLIARYDMQGIDFGKKKEGFIWSVNDICFQLLLTPFYSQGKWKKQSIPKCLIWSHSLSCCLSACTCWLWDCCNCSCCRWRNSCCCRTSSLWSFKSDSLTAGPLGDKSADLQQNLKTFFLTHLQCTASVKYRKKESWNKVNKGMHYSGSHDLQTLLITETWLSAA